jgi:hypothetical protein
VKQQGRSKQGTNSAHTFRWEAESTEVGPIPFAGKKRWGWRTIVSNLGAKLGVWPEYCNASNFSVSYTGKTAYLCRADLMGSAKIHKENIKPTQNGIDYIDLLTLHIGK